VNNRNIHMKRQELLLNCKEFRNINKKESFILINDYYEIIIKKSASGLDCKPGSGFLER